jgi:hypothetical protein
VLSFTNFLFNTLNKIITHYRRLANHFALHHELLFAHPSLNILHHCLEFLHLLHFGRKPRVIHKGFPQ